MTTLSSLQLDHVLPLVSKLSFYQQLPAQFQRCVLENMKLMKFDAESIVVTQGDTSSSLFIILSGQVALFSSQNSWSEGAQEFLCSLKEGDSFGSLSLFESLPRSCTVACVDDTVLAVLTRDAFRAAAAGLYSRHPFWSLSHGEMPTYAYRTQRADLATYLEVLQKNASARTEEETDLLLTITRRARFFQMLSKRLRALVSEHFQHQFVPSGTILFAQEDAVDYTYFVIDGSLSKHVRPPRANSHCSLLTQPLIKAADTTTVVPSVDPSGKSDATPSSPNLVSLYGPCETVYAAPAWLGFVDPIDNFALHRQPYGSDARGIARGEYGADEEDEDDEDDDLPAEVHTETLDRLTLQRRGGSGGSRTPSRASGSARSRTRGDGGRDDKIARSSNSSSRPASPPIPAHPWLGTRDCTVIARENTHLIRLHIPTVRRLLRAETARFRFPFESDLTSPNRETRRQLKSRHQELHSVLQRAPSKRSPQDVSRLLSLVGHVKLFQTHDTATREQLCTHLQYESLPPGCVIYRQGQRWMVKHPPSHKPYFHSDSGLSSPTNSNAVEQKYYLLLSGSVSVHVLPVDATARSSRPGSPGSSRLHGESSQYIHGSSTDHPHHNGSTYHPAGCTAKLSALDRFAAIANTRRADNVLFYRDLEAEMGPCHQVLSKGQSFGEEEMMGEIDSKNRDMDVNWSARMQNGGVNSNCAPCTLICRERVEVVTLSRTDMESVLSVNVHDDREDDTLQLQDAEEREKIIKLLEILPARRTEDEVAQLARMLAPLPFLSNMSAEMRTYVCRHFLHESISRDTVVFEQGDVAAHMFIVLKGSISVHIRPEDKLPEHLAQKPSTMRERRKSHFQELAAEKMFQHIHQKPGNNTNESQSGANAASLADKTAVAEAQQIVGSATDAFVTAKVPVDYTQTQRQGAPGTAGQNSTLTESTEHESDGDDQESALDSRPSSPTESMKGAHPRADNGVSAIELPMGARNRRVSLAVTGNISVVELEARYGRCCQVLHRVGDTFGEKAVAEQCLRSATCITREPTHLITLDTESYLRTVKHVANKSDLTELTDFLMKLDLFQKMPRAIVTRMGYCSEKRTYKRGEVFFEQGQEMNELCLLVTGQAQLTRSLRVTHRDCKVADGLHNWDDGEPQYDPVLVMNGHYSSDCTVFDMTSPVCPPDVVAEMKLPMTILREADICNLHDLALHPECICMCHCFCCKNRHSRGDFPINVCPVATFEERRSALISRDDAQAAAIAASLHKSKVCELMAQKPTTAVGRHRIEPPPSQNRGNASMFDDCDSVGGGSSVVTAAARAVNSKPMSIRDAERSGDKKCACCRKHRAFASLTQWNMSKMYTSSCTALTDVQVLMIPRNVLWKFLTRDMGPTIKEQFIRHSRELSVQRQALHMERCQEYVRGQLRLVANPALERTLSHSGTRVSRLPNAHMIVVDPKSAFHLSSQPSGASLLGRQENAGNTADSSDLDSAAATALVLSKYAKHSDPSKTAAAAPRAGTAELLQLSLASHQLALQHASELTKPVEVISTAAGGGSESSLMGPERMRMARDFRSAETVLVQRERQRWRQEKEVLAMMSQLHTEVSTGLRDAAPHASHSQRTAKLA